MSRFSRLTKGGSKIFADDKDLEHLHVPKLERSHDLSQISY